MHYVHMKDFFCLCPSIFLIQERSSINLVLRLSHVITYSIFSSFEFVCHMCAGIRLCRIYTLFLQFNNIYIFCFCCKFLFSLCRSYRMEYSQCGFQFQFYRVLKLYVPYLQNLQYLCCVFINSLHLFLAQSSKIL